MTAHTLQCLARKIPLCLQIWQNLLRHVEPVINVLLSESVKESLSSGLFWKV